MLRNLMVACVLLSSVAGGIGAEPLIVAHRGASHDAPENTLAAFRLAWEQGADAIEGDFYLSKDKRVVCIHDATTKRTGGRDWKVANTAFDDLRALDVGAWKGAQWAGERIPTFEEVAGTVPAGKGFYIELKTGPEIVGPFQAALARTRLTPEQTVVIAFNAKTVAEVRRQLPALKVYWLTGYKQDPQSGAWTPKVTTILETLKQSRASGLGSEGHAVVDEAMAHAVVGAGFSLHVWTIDDPTAGVRFRKLGVGSITTNRPRWLREQMRELQELAGGSGK